MKSQSRVTERKDVEALDPSLSCDVVARYYETFRKRLAEHSIEGLSRSIRCRFERKMVAMKLGWLQDRWDLSGARRLSMKIRSIERGVCTRLPIATRISMLKS
jgi:hypothetical protein